MAFKSTNPNSKEFIKTRKWKDWKKDEYFIGEFEEVGKHHDKFGKDIYSFTVRESNFGAEPGEVIHLNLGGNFQNLMESVSLGDEVKVLYKGMAKITKGKWTGTMTHDIDVQVDEPESANESLL